MADFIHSGWSLYITIVTVVGIIFCLWLALAMARGRQPGKSVGTTGHSWDEDLQELNNPLPRWWLWLFMITIVFSLGYLWLYPGLGARAGSLGWSQAQQYQQEVKRFDAVTEPQGGQGASVYPNLNDDHWMWGGSLEQIYQTIQYGIRNENPESRQGPMPAFGKDGIIQKADIPDVAAYVVTLSGRKPEGKADLAKGQKLFADNCAACHGDAGKGNPDVGAPNLTANIWLYGGDEKSIIETITNGRGGVMPGWAGRLEPATIKALAVYVHTLGGGQ